MWLNHLNDTTTGCPGLLYESADLAERYHRRLSVSDQAKEWPVSPAGPE